MVIDWAVLTTAWIAETQLYFEKKARSLVAV